MFAIFVHTMANYIPCINDLTQVFKRNYIQQNNTYKQSFFNLSHKNLV